MKLLIILACFLFQDLTAECCSSKEGYWCNTTLHRLELGGELACSNGGPLVELTRRVFNAWSVRCADSHSNFILSPFSNTTVMEWIQSSNASYADPANIGGAVLHESLTSLHCPANSFLTGLKMTQDGVLLVACNVLARGYQLDTDECSLQPIPSPHTNQSLTATRPLLFTSLHQTQRAEWEAYLCTMHRVRCEAPVIHQGKTSVDRESEVHVGSLSSGIFLYPGENITVTCNRGLYLKKGLSSTHCQANGSWSMLPVCKRCRPIKNCRINSCTKRANTVCLKCLDSHQPSASGEECYFGPSLFVSPVVWNGNRATISCGATGSPIPVLRFFLNHTEELNSISTMIDETTRTLNLTTEVMGVYRCVASNVVGNKTWLFTVGSSIVYSAPVIVAHEVKGVPSRSYFICPIPLNDDSLFPCNTRGNPVPIHSWWYKTNGTFVPISLIDGGRWHQYSNGSLLIRRVQPSDKGEYKCIARNTLGIAQQTYHINVWDPRTGHHYVGGSLPKDPVIVNWTTNYTVAAHHPLTMYCNITPSHNLTVTWLKGQQYIDPALVNDEGELYLATVSHNDTGVYGCAVFDLQGELLDYKGTVVFVFDSPQVNTSTLSTTAVLYTMSRTSTSQSESTAYTMDQSDSSTSNCNLTSWILIATFCTLLYNYL
ncbi:uncharacterized protein LOC135347121 [Halichondria panicea]|uniref:uncharacterized protein LOC135347121 n=1 Tax=Halichondria panicea TaxID=6063 RepID=UPI00312BB8F4